MSGWSRFLSSLSGPQCHPSPLRRSAQISWTFSAMASPSSVSCGSRYKIYFVSLSKLLIMRILGQPITRSELKALARNTFGDMIKCVADVRRGLLAMDADLHADLERLLLDAGSAEEDLWGFNLWVEEEGEDFIEFDSLINIRSWQGNPSRDVEDPQVRKAIVDIVARFIQ